MLESTSESFPSPFSPQPMAVTCLPTMGLSVVLCCFVLFCVVLCCFVLCVVCACVLYCLYCSTLWSLFVCVVCVVYCLCCLCCLFVLCDTHVLEYVGVDYVNSRQVENNVSSSTRHVFSTKYETQVHNTKYETPTNTHIRTRHKYTIARTSFHT